MTSLPRESSRASARAVRVLEADPDLGTGIDEAQLQLAARMAIAPAFEFERGPWRFSPRPDPGSLGAVILEGMILVRIDAGAGAHIGVMGAGVVVCQWVW